MPLPEKADLAVLLGDEFLAHRGDLDEQVLVGEVEVGCEPSDGFAGVVKLDVEGSRFVFPGDSVEVEETGELPFAVVCEIDGIGLGVEVDGQVRPPWLPV